MATPRIPLAQVFATSASGLVGAALGWRYVLWGTAAIGLAGAAAAVSALPRSAGKRDQRFSVGLVWSNYRLVFRNPKAILCYTTVFLEGVALYGIMPYVGAILRLHALGGAREAGVIIGAIGVGGLLYVSLVSTLLKRWTRRHFMAVGGLLMVAGPLALAFVDHWPNTIPFRRKRWTLRQVRVNPHTPCTRFHSLLARRSGHPFSASI